MVSGQTTLVQKLSAGLPVGSVPVCISALSVEGLVLPTRAAYVPECAPVLTTAVTPDEVQPLSRSEERRAGKKPTSLPPMDQHTAAVWVKEPLVPVTVTVYAPAAALPAVNDNVALPPADMLLALNDAVAPAGAPLTPSATLPLKPPEPVTEMLLEADAPLTDAGLAASEKSALL